MADLDAFRARPARGSRPIVRPACARRCPTTRSCGADGAALQTAGCEALARAHGGQGLDGADLAASEYGGGGLSPDEARILEEEMRRLGCRPPLQSFGIWMLGPCCCEYGSEEQKRRASAARSPAARSAGARATASPRRAPTSPASRRAPCCKASISWSTATRSGPPTPIIADWIFCLVRTDPMAKKHEGISFLLIDMADPGVRTRPIRLISGASPFCETFFENVRVPAGEPGRRAQQGLDHRQAPAGARAQDDRAASASASAAPRCRSPALAKRYAGETRRPDRRRRCCATASRNTRWTRAPSS